MNHAPDEMPSSPDADALALLAPQLAQTLVTMASDVALVIDAQGVIRHVARAARAALDTTGIRPGSAWAETVTGSTRHKIDLLIAEARHTGMTQRREVNHPVPGGDEVPMAYAAIRLGLHGPLLAVGRDLRTVAAMQQRLIDAQQALEHDYWQQRQAEARYRLLFQVATDAVLVVQAQSLRIVDANPAAGMLLGCASGDLVGQGAAQALARTAPAGVEQLLLMAQATGRPAEGRVRVQPSDGPTPLLGALDLSATPFRSGDTALLLVRARSVNTSDELPVYSSRLARFVERSPDAMLIIDGEHRVRQFNPAFESLCRQSGSRPASSTEALPALIGQRLEDLLGDPKFALQTLVQDTRRTGIVQRRRLTVCAGRASRGQVVVEASAALLDEEAPDSIGLTLRLTGAPAAALTAEVDALTASIDRLAAQMGVVPLPDLVQQAGELTERHLILTALGRARNDPAQAAPILGISAEALWRRMLHHGLGAGGGEAEPASHRLN